MFYRECKKLLWNGGYSLIGLYIIRILINLIKGLITLVVSPEPLLKSKGELQMETLQDKVLT